MATDITDWRRDAARAGLSVALDQCSGDVEAAALAAARALDGFTALDAPVDPADPPLRLGGQTGGAPR